MTSSQHPTLSAVLGKAKVGGLVLAATVLVAGTAEAATGGDLFTQDTTTAQSAAESDVVDPLDCPTEEPVIDPSTDPSTDPSSEPTGEPTSEEEPTAEPETTVEPAPTVTDEPTDCASPSVSPTDDATDPTEDPSATDEPTETEEPEPSDEPVACEDARNHGEYVSSVAKSVPPGPGHGAAVSEAARSDCGKKNASDSEGASETDDTDTDDEGSEQSKPGNNPQSDGWVPPGQAKKDETSSGESSAPGNSGNAPGHNK